MQISYFLFNLSVNDFWRSLFQDSPETWELLTYAPTYGEKFEFSHTHYLYTNDLQRLEDIPPPHTSPTRKHEIFDPDAYQHVDERTDAVSIYFSSTLIDQCELNSKVWPKIRKCRPWERQPEMFYIHSLYFKMKCLQKIL